MEKDISKYSRMSSENNTKPMWKSPYPEIAEEEFTWGDAISIYPTLIPLFIPFYLMNLITDGTGGGYQKFVPHSMIPKNKRKSVPTRWCYDSWKH
jgi:hypothetical protein